MRIAVGSDHSAFELKQLMKQVLTELGHDVEDLGAYTGEEPADDYHLIGAAVAEAVVRGEADRGLLMCGTGIGMSIAANKVPGASAALCTGLFTAVKSRQHNNANVLVLGARVTGPALAEEIVRAWLATQYERGRHERRNQNLRAIEHRYTQNP